MGRRRNFNRQATNSVLEKYRDLEGQILQYNGIEYTIRVLKGGVQINCDGNSMQVNLNGNNRVFVRLVTEKLGELEKKVCGKRLTSGEKQITSRKESKGSEFEEYGDFAPILKDVQERLGSRYNVSFYSGRNEIQVTKSGFDGIFYDEINTETDSAKLATRIGMNGGKNYFSKFTSSYF